MKGAYGALKNLIKGRLPTPADEDTVDRHEEKPEVWRGPLEDALKTAGAQDDPEIVAAAQRLMELIDPAGAQEGKYQVVNQGPVQGQIIGDHATATMNFGGGGGAAEESPKAP